MLSTVLEYEIQCGMNKRRTPESWRIGLNVVAPNVVGKSNVRWYPLFMLCCSIGIRHSPSTLHAKHENEMSRLHSNAGVSVPPPYDNVFVYILPPTFLPAVELTVFVNFSVENVCGFDDVK